MRINKFIATATEYSRRSADILIAKGKVLVDGLPAKPGQQLMPGQKVSLNNRLLELPESFTTIMLNKPVGYVVSRNGQGARTVYELLPDKYNVLKAVGRLDKDSSGLLILTNDGQLAQKLSHPSGQKSKVYVIELSKPLAQTQESLISGSGIKLEDGISRLGLKKLDRAGLSYQVNMGEGRNRQIRRTFEAIGYKVTKLRRIRFGDYNLNELQQGKYLEL